MKNNLKKIFVGVILTICLVSLVGCGEKEETNYIRQENKSVEIKKSESGLKSERIMSDGSYQIRFGDLVSLESLKEYKDKKVTAIGYMSPIMGYKGDFGYLMNLPYQTCPYCIPGDGKITNTISIFAKEGEKIGFTEAAVIVSGILKLEEYTDEYGYTYDYRIVDATVEKADTQELGEKIALYNKLAEKNILGGLMETLYCVDDNVYHQYYVSTGGQEYDYYMIDTTILNQIIEDLKEFDQEQVEDLVTMASNLKALIETINPIIEQKNYSQLSQYMQVDDALFNSINSWMIEYQL